MKQHRLRHEASQWTLGATRLLIGGLFLIAAAGKLQFPYLFSDALAQYRIFHQSVRYEVALVVLWLEMLVGLLLLLGFWTRAAATLAAWMLAFYLVANASAVLRGLQFDCRCFGELIDGQIGWPTVARTALVLAATATLALAGGGKAQFGELLPDGHWEPLPDPAQPRA